MPVPRREIDPELEPVPRQACSTSFTGPLPSAPGARHCSRYGAKATAEAVVVLPPYEIARPPPSRPAPTAPRQAALDRRRRLRRAVTPLAILKAIGAEMDQHADLEVCHAICCGFGLVSTKLWPASAETSAGASGTDRSRDRRESSQCGCGFMALASYHERAARIVAQPFSRGEHARNRVPLPLDVRVHSISYRIIRIASRNAWEYFYRCGRMRMQLFPR